MTVLDDMWQIIDMMITQKITGIYNLVNPGLAEHSWILEQYRKMIDPLHSWHEVSYQEQMKYIKSHRSNNQLDTTKLLAFCGKYGLTIPHIEESILRCLEERSN
jgi:hypothetical protein